MLRREINSEAGDLDAALGRIPAIRPDWCVKVMRVIAAHTLFVQTDFV